MLHDFLTHHRADLIARCRSKVAQRRLPQAFAQKSGHGIPIFLDQLIKTLELEESQDLVQSRQVSGLSSGEGAAASEMDEAATLHGRELLAQGFTVDQVVHDYGDLCQAITDLACEKEAAVEVDEFRTLNRCLDNAIAEAVAAFSRQHNVAMVDKAVQSLNERLGFLAHELRNHIHTASLALSFVKAGNVGVTGATGAILTRSLIKLRTLVDRSLADVRVTAGMPAVNRLFSLADFIAEMQSSASLEAVTRDCVFTVSIVDPSLAVNGDRDLLFSAVGNLLQNAFKFTHHQTEVTLNAYAAADRIVIEVQDNCGGLPPGSAQHMFLPFKQSGTDRSGLGLGLSICRRTVEANNGVLSVRDIPGFGCIFTIDLPRHEMPRDRSAPDRRAA